MLSRIQSLGSCLIVLAVLLFAGSAAAKDVSPACEAAVDRAAGRYGQCLLGADAHHARHGNTQKLEKKQTRCQARFDRRTSRVINRHGEDECPSDELMTALADRTVSYAAGAALEAGGTPAPSLLYVQNASGGILTSSALTLNGTGTQTAVFTDRPYRESGQMTTEDFVALFYADGANSFADDPPNADFTCVSSGETVNEIVTLTDPSYDETTGTLNYTVDLVSSGASPLGTVVCDADAHLFIDSGTDSGSTATKSAFEIVYLGGASGGAKGTAGKPTGSVVDGELYAMPGDTLKFAIGLKIGSAGANAWSVDLQWDGGKVDASKVLPNALKFISSKEPDYFPKAIRRREPGYVKAIAALPAVVSHPAQSGELPQASAARTPNPGITLSQTSFRTSTVTFQVLEGFTAETKMQLGFFHQGAAMETSASKLTTPSFGSFTVQPPKYAAIDCWSAQFCSGQEEFYPPAEYEYPTIYSGVKANEGIALLCPFDNAFLNETAGHKFFKDGVSKKFVQYAMASCNDNIWSPRHVMTLQEIHDSFQAYCEKYPTKCISTHSSSQ